RDLDRDLLPAGLPRPHAQIRQLPLLRLGGGGAGGGVPALPALPAGDRADLAFWRGSSNTVSRALALMADGALDADTSVEALAERLGVGGRQLRRLFKQHLGASPVAVAQTRRVL